MHRMMGSWVKEIFLWFILTPQIILYSPKRSQKWEMTCQMCMPQRISEPQFSCRAHSQKSNNNKRITNWFLKEPLMWPASKRMPPAPWEQCCPEKKQEHNANYQKWGVGFASHRACGLDLSLANVFSYFKFFSLSQHSLLLSTLWISSYDKTLPISVQGKIVPATWL